MSQKKDLLSLETLQHRLPVSVITGFLGSGKTTLLNKLLQHPELHNAAIVVNEFGDVGLDHLLVSPATEDVILMDSGCVCCTIRGDLIETLDNLFKQRGVGDVSQFDRIIIETSGLADPASIIRTLLDDPILTKNYVLDSVITTVDGVYGLKQLDEHYETVKQAAVADRMILTKTDIAQQDITALTQRLQRLNPAATMLKSVHGEIENVTQLFNAGLYNPKSKSLDVQQWLQSHTYASTSINIGGISKKLKQQHQEALNPMIQHDEYIQSFCIEYDDALSWTVLSRWFRQLAALRGKDLLRTKGIVYTKETDLPIVVQGVQHIFQPPTTLPHWQDDKRRSQIVFITRNIKKSVVEKMLDIIVESKSYVEACAAAVLLLES